MLACECGKPKSYRAANCRTCAQRKRWQDDESRRNNLIERNRALRAGRVLYEDKEWMQRLYLDEGMSLRAIAAVSNSSVRTIARWIQIHDIPTRHQGTRTEAQAAAAQLRRRDQHWNWKGGRRADGKGYVKVLVPDDIPFKVPTDRCGYIFEHRLVMALAIGRALRSDETVHHLDGDSRNNDLRNLQLRQGNHGKGVVMTCGHCGSHDVVAAPIGKEVMPDVA